MAAVGCDDDNTRCASDLRCNVGYETRYVIDIERGESEVEEPRSDREAVVRIGESTTVL